MKKILITALAVLAIAGAPAAVSAQAPTTIILLQGIPTPPNVDVRVDGATVTNSTNIAQGAVINATDYAGLTPSVEVVATGTSDVLMAAETVSVPGTGHHSIVLTTEGVMTFANNLNPVAEGQARLTLRNTADVASINLVGGSQPINGVGMGAEGSVDQAAGQLSAAQIIDAAGAVLADVPTTNLAAGTNTIIYLIGDSTNYQVIQQVIEVPVTPTDTTTTTTVAGSTTSTTSTTSTSTTSTTSTAVPVAVNTGAPIDEGNSMLWILVVAGGLAVAGGAYFVRRRA